MISKQYPETVQVELDRALLATQEKNDGKARASCRRAVGAAVKLWLKDQAEPPEWGRSAIGQLRTLVGEASVPAAVRHAAARLSTSVAEDHTLPFDNDPIEDAEIIIRHFVKSYIH